MAFTGDPFGTAKKRAGKHLDDATDPMGREGAGDGLTAAGEDRAARRARRDERAAARLGEPPPEAGFPAEPSPLSVAIHDGVAAGKGMHQILAEFNPGFYGNYYRPPGGTPAPAAPAPAPAPMPGDPAALGLPPMPAGLPAGMPGGLPAGVPGPFAPPPPPGPGATVNTFGGMPPAPPPGMPPAPPMGMVPPGGGLAGLRRRGY